MEKAGPPEVIAAAESKSPGATAEAIADATADVRNAISTGNCLDLNTAAIPNSLKRLVARRAFFALAALIQYDLSKDLNELRSLDEQRLNRIADRRVRVEQPDNPDGTAEMQTQPSPVIRRKRRSFTTRTMDGI